MLQDLAVLTPSLVVCAAFLTGVFLLLRHELAPRRRGREGDRPQDSPDHPGNSAVEQTTATAPSDQEEAEDRQPGRRT
jgi:hypothetical protein